MVNWHGYHCPGCGGTAWERIMSLGARCEECGAKRYSGKATLPDGTQLSPGHWVIPAEGAD
jgi:hypothetical protein